MCVILRVASNLFSFFSSSFFLPSPVSLFLSFYFHQPFLKEKKKWGDLKKIPKFPTIQQIDIEFRSLA